MAEAALPFAMLLTFAVALLSAACLHAWRQWLALKRTELAGRAAREPRGELGELRRRIRHLEALANGVEL